MKKIFLQSKTMLLGFILLCCFIPGFGQNTPSATIDLEKARLTIDSLDRQFSQHFYNGDSLALYAMYAEGSYFGTAKGKDILTAWSKQITNAINEDTRLLIFTINSLTTDNEFLFERGTYEIKDSREVVKYTGKYILVWKNEDGSWKIYRDMGL